MRPSKRVGNVNEYWPLILRSDTTKGTEFEEVKTISNSLPSGELPKSGGSDWAAKDDTYENTESSTNRAEDQADGL